LSSVSLGEFQDSMSKLGHDLFLPNPFKLFIHLSPFHLMLYSISYWTIIIK
jgi:hypothetical protein